MIAACRGLGVKAELISSFRDRDSPGKLTKIRKEQDENKLSEGGDGAAGSDDEMVSKFMMDLGGCLSEQNSRFKVTIKKKYINDILMHSKGAQNLAQQVVVLDSKLSLRLSFKAIVNIS